MEETDKQRQSSEVKARRMANLKPYKFQPGTSGNPSGRPKNPTFAEVLRIQLAQLMPGKPQRTYLEGIAKMLCVDAARGSIAAAREIFDRTDGRPRQAIDVGIGSDGGGAQLVVIQMPDNDRNDRVNPPYEEGAEPLELPPFGDSDEVEADVE